MSTADRRIDPTTPAVGTDPVRDYMPGRPAVPAGGSPSSAHAVESDEPVAATAGHLRAAYTQFVVDPETHDVSVRVRDAATDEVIRQIPAAEVEAITKALRQYAQALALRHAAAQAKAGA
jgi:FlaG protein